MRYYFGERDEKGARVWLADLGAERQPLPLYRNLWDHSPTGFEWGYKGSGPAQLALALAAHATGDGRRAVRVHQALKEALVSRWCRNAWVLRESDLLVMIRRLEANGEDLIEDDPSEAEEVQPDQLAGPDLDEDGPGAITRLKHLED